MNAWCTNFVLVTAPNLRCIRLSQDPLLWSIQTAITKHHRLGGLQTIALFLKILYIGNSKFRMLIVSLSKERSDFSEKKITEDDAHMPSWFSIMRTLIQSTRTHLHDLASLQSLVFQYYHLLHEDFSISFSVHHRYSSVVPFFAQISN